MDKSNEKRIFLAGWEAKFNGDEQCQRFIQTQVVDEMTANEVYSAIELVFENDLLIRAYDIEEGDKQERDLDNSEIGMEYIEIEPNSIYELMSIMEGNSFLGGEPPADFQMPKFEFNAPFQYLGMLSKLDKPFESLPFDLHLISPIYLDMGQLFIDYSNPNHPIVLDIETLKNTGTAYTELKSDSEIIYKKEHFRPFECEDYGDGLGHTGVPNWVQYPNIPVCPKSKKTMKFLAQFESGPATERTNVIPSNDFFKRYFDQMNFWADGCLFVFFEPESKVVCYFIQNT